MSRLVLKQASASRLPGEWKDDDKDMLVDGKVVGRTFHAAPSPIGTLRMWIQLSRGSHAHARYAATREAGMVPFAKYWWRE